MTSAAHASPRQPCRAGCGLRMTVGIAACSLAGLAQACAAVKDLGASGSVADAGNDARADAADAATDVATDGFGGDAATYEPTALFIHASPSLPDVRLCWSIDGVTAATAPFPGSGAMPGSNYPGIPKGGAASLADAHGLAGGTLTLYAVDAESLARNGESEVAMRRPLICPAASSCLRKNLDYWALASIDGSAFSSGANVVVAVSGCWASVLDPAATAERCERLLGPGRGQPARGAAQRAAARAMEGSTAARPRCRSRSSRRRSRPRWATRGSPWRSGPPTGASSWRRSTRRTSCSPRRPSRCRWARRSRSTVPRASRWMRPCWPMRAARPGCRSRRHKRSSIRRRTRAPSSGRRARTSSRSSAILGAAHAFVTTADGGYDGTGLHVARRRGVARARRNLRERRPRSRRRPRRQPEGHT